MSTNYYLISNPKSILKLYLNILNLSILYFIKIILIFKRKKVKKDISLHHISKKK